MGKMGVSDITQSQTPEARNVKFGMYVPIAINVTTKKGFFINHPLKG